MIKIDQLNQTLAASVIAPTKNNYRILQQSEKNRLKQLLKGDIKCQ